MKISKKVWDSFDSQEKQMLPILARRHGLVEIRYMYKDAKKFADGRPYKIINGVTIQIGDTIYKWSGPETRYFKSYET